jgi:hypothetical protein
MLRRFADAGLPIDTAAWLAPAMRVNDFVTNVLGHLGSLIRRFTVFNLNDQRELDDVCAAGDVVIYRKSVLYLISRALERPGPVDRGEVPLLGMERFFSRAIRDDGTTLQQAIERAGGSCVFAPRTAPGDDRTDAGGHGGFAADPLTMTSVMMRILDLRVSKPENEYRLDAPLTDPGPALPAGGDPRSVETPEPTVASSTGGLPLEVAEAPRTGKPVLDILRAEGWTVTTNGQVAPRARRDGRSDGVPRRRRASSRSAAAR